MHYGALSPKWVIKYSNSVHQSFSKKRRPTKRKCVFGWFAMAPKRKGKKERNVWNFTAGHTHERSCCRLFFSFCFPSVSSLAALVSAVARSDNQCAVFMSRLTLFSILLSVFPPRPTLEQTSASPPNPSTPPTPSPPYPKSHLSSPYHTLYCRHCCCSCS